MTYTPASIQRVRKRPVVVEAVPFDGTPQSATEIIDWILGHGGHATWSEPYPAVSNADGTLAHEAWPGGLKIQTLEGPLRGAAGCVVIRGVQGEFYPIDPDIYAATYEPA